MVNKFFNAHPHNIDVVIGTYNTTYITDYIVLIQEHEQNLKWKEIE